MSIVLHIMDARGTFTEYKKQITDTFDKTITQITRVLPVDNVDVVIQDNPEVVIPELGVGGHTYGPNYVVLGLNTQRKDCEKAIINQLPGVLAHELHHCARWAKIGYGETLLKSMISEGLATQFERELFGVIEPWATALSEEEIKMWMKKAKKEFSSKKYNHYAWFFGYGSRKIPRWTGYTLGYKLVGDYLALHPQTSPSKLFDVPASNFI